MNDHRRLLLTILALAIAFDRLFWTFDIGINLSLFAALAAGAIALHRWRTLSVAARWALVGVLLSAGMAVVHGSFAARSALIGALLAFAGLAHAAELRTPAMAVLHWVLGAVTAPIAWAHTLRGAFGRRVPLGGTWRWARLVVLPVAVLGIYVLLYRGGNSRFNAMTAGLMDGLGRALDRLFSEVLTPHALFFLFALLVCGSLLMHFGGQGLVQLELRQSDRLSRIRVRRPHWMPALSMGALDRERRMGVVLLVLVNALLVVVNAIDIEWLWTGFTVPPHFSLKEFVHEGTWLLIVSILLSMGILLYLFRNNLNFHPRARVLRILAFAWIAQNFVLGISVFLRNYHYIAFHGLAYLRIGVIVFLVLVLVGLITMALKVRDRRSFFYLFRVNGWAAFAALVALGTVDWDRTIVRYNLHHWNSGEIDVDNYLAMSDRVLPLLYAELPKAEEQMRKHRSNEVRWIEHLDPIAFRQELDAKRTAFLRRFAHHHWQEWTWADQRTYAALQGLDLTGPPTTE